MHSTWKLLEQVFTVETLMTPRAQLLTYTYTGSEPLESLWEQARRLKVDTIPVEEGDKIVSVLRRGHAEPFAITSEWLISPGASIPDALQAFAGNGESKSYLLVSSGDDIVGIVTPADLNKLPARTYFYNLLADLEMQLAEHIRAYFGQDQDVIFTLVDRQDELDEIKEKMEKHKLEIDIVHFLEFSNLVNILRKTDDLREKLGFPSRTQVEKQLNGLVDFRHDVMHSVRLILDDYNGIDQLNTRVKRATTILKQLNSD